MLKLIAFYNFQFVLSPFLMNSPSKRFVHTVEFWLASSPIGLQI